MKTKIIIVALLLTLIIGCGDKDNPSNSSGIDLEQPTDLRATERTGKAITLAWKDNSEDESFYTIERSDSGNYAFSKIDTLVANAETFYDIYVVHGNAYYYRVRSGRGSLRSEYSDVIEVIANAPPEIPSQPEPGDSTSNISFKTELKWWCSDKDDREDSTDLDQYVLYFGTAENPQEALDTITATPKDTPYVYDRLFDLDLDTTYHWRVTAIDKHGEEAESPTWTFATTASKSWVKTFGTSLEDGGAAAIETSDGGYFMVGTTLSESQWGNYDMWLIRVDESGNKLFDRKFGGPQQDLGYSINQTSDGGYILGGATRSLGAVNYDMYVVKTDETGNQQDANHFGGDGSERCHMARQTSDGGYILVGDGPDAIYVVKTNDRFIETWSQTFEGNPITSGSDVWEMPEGGYVVTGTVTRGSDTKIWLLRLDGNGLIVWTREIQGELDSYGYSSIVDEGSGEITVLGITNSDGALSSDSWLMFYTSYGELRFERKFRSDDRDLAYSIRRTHEGGLIQAGERYSYEAGPTLQSVWLRKTDEDGWIEWSKTIADSVSLNWRGSAINTTSDGGYIIAGAAQVGAWLAKSDNWGNIMQDE
ncbi:hypothetical protein ACFLQJ_01120 [Calditrichota bacterium]